MYIYIYICSVAAISSEALHGSSGRRSRNVHLCAHANNNSNNKNHNNNNNKKNNNNNIININNNNNNNKLYQ